MATRKQKKAPKAKASKAIQAASEVSIDDQFQPVRATLLADLLKIGEATKGEAAAQEARASASLDVFECAAKVAYACSQAGIDSETAAEGYAANLDRLMPQLYKGKFPYVERTDKGTFKWKGYGANLKSWSKGTIEFGIDYTECVGKNGDIQVSLIAKAVSAARSSNAPTEERDLKEARQAMGNVLKTIKQVYGNKCRDYELIEARTEALQALADSWAKQDRQQAELEAEATKKEQEEKAAAAEAVAEAMEAA